MRDLPEARVERTRSVGDVPAASPVEPDDIESAVRACVSPRTFAEAALLAWGEVPVLHTESLPPPAGPEQCE